MGTLRNIYQVGAIQEVFDFCLNLSDVQAAMPDGWYRDNLSGNCTDVPPRLPNSCEGIVISEIAANSAKQFIEIYNSADTEAELLGCQIMTNRSTTKSYVFPDVSLSSKSFHVVYIDQTVLTLTKTTSGTVYLLSEEGDVEVSNSSYANLAEDTSWAVVGGEWLQTYSPTPAAENVYMQYLPCETGYVRNSETGRCNKVTEVLGATDCAEGYYRNPETNRCRKNEVASVLTPCKAGQYRSPETNRCRNIDSSTSALAPCKPGQERNPDTNRCRSIVGSNSSLVPCKEGQERNPETNRCRSIASQASALKPCQEGWERNPDTNRCRKVLGAAAEAALPFPVESVADTGRAFAAWWALGGIVMLGLVYGVWEWRYEIRRGLQRVGAMIST